jgi:hypothetical protein
MEERLRTPYLPFSPPGNVLYVVICFLAGCLAWKWVLIG